MLLYLKKYNLGGEVSLSCEQAEPRYLESVCEITVTGPGEVSNAVDGRLHLGVGPVLVEVEHDGRRVRVANDADACVAESDRKLVDEAAHEVLHRRPTGSRDVTAVVEREHHVHRHCTPRTQHHSCNKNIFTIFIVQLKHALKTGVIRIGF